MQQRSHALLLGAGATPGGPASADPQGHGPHEQCAGMQSTCRG